MVDNTKLIQLSNHPFNFSTLILFRVLPKHTLKLKRGYIMNFQVRTFLGQFNFVSFIAAESAAKLTGGSIHRILGKQGKQYVLGSAI